MSATLDIWGCNWKSAEKLCANAPSAHKFIACGKVMTARRDDFFPIIVYPLISAGGVTNVGRFIPWSCK